VFVSIKRTQKEKNTC